MCRYSFIYQYYYFFYLSLFFLFLLTTRQHLTNLYSGLTWQYFNPIKENLIYYSVSVAILTFNGHSCSAHASVNINVFTYLQREIRKLQERQVFLQQNGENRPNSNTCAVKITIQYCEINNNVLQCVLVLFFCIRKIY